MLLPAYRPIDAVVQQRIAHFLASEIGDMPECSEKFLRWARMPRLNPIKKMIKGKFHPLLRVAFNRIKQGCRMVEHRLEVFPATVSSCSPRVASVDYGNQDADFVSCLDTVRAGSQLRTDFGNKLVELLFREDGHQRARSIETTGDLSTVPNDDASLAMTIVTMPSPFSLKTKLALALVRNTTLKIERRASCMRAPSECRGWDIFDILAV
jgi:hypothetical protein